jgi:hypothetical protein
LDVQKLSDENESQKGGSSEHWTTKLSKIKKCGKLYVEQKFGGDLNFQEKYIGLCQ